MWSRNLTSATLQHFENTSELILLFSCYETYLSRLSHMIYKHSHAFCSSKYGFVKLVAKLGHDYNLKHCAIDPPRSCCYIVFIWAEELDEFESSGLAHCTIGVHVSYETRRRTTSCVFTVLSSSVQDSALLIYPAIDSSIMPVQRESEQDPLTPQLALLFVGCRTCARISICRFFTRNSCRAGGSQYLVEYLLWELSRGSSQIVIALHHSRQARNEFEPHCVAELKYAVTSVIQFLPRGESPDLYDINHDFDVGELWRSKYSQLCSILLRLDKISWGPCLVNIARSAPWPA